MQEKNDVVYEIEGNQWCAHRKDFIDLQNSPAGFGDTQKQALKNLIKNEKDNCEHQGELKNGICLECGANV